MKTPKMRFSEIPDHLGGKTVDQKIAEFGKIPNFGPKSEGLPLGRQYRGIRENTKGINENPSENHRTEGYRPGNDRK